MVTSVVVTGANIPDGDVMDKLIEERALLTGGYPLRVMGDTAYGSLQSDSRITIRVRPDEKRIQEKRAEQATPKWQAHYREHSRVKHVNESMARHGGREACYFGHRKTEFQLRVCAIVHNITEMSRVQIFREKRARNQEQCS